MILCIPIIYAFFLKSATENQYVGLDSNALVMVDEPNATEFDKIEDNSNKTYTIIRIDSNRNIYSDGSGKVSIGSKKTAFSFLLSEKGSFLIQNDGMCLGYSAGTRNIELRKCSEQGFNSGFVLVESTSGQAKETRMRFGTRKTSPTPRSGNASGHDFRQIEPQDLEALMKPYKKASDSASTPEGGIEVAREFVKFNVF